MKNVLPGIFIGAIALSCTHQDQKLKKETKPNILLILADDLGYGDLGCYNENSKIPTPNLDGLGKKGMLFTDAHAPSALCTPTRYGIMTGKYCWRTELKSGVLLPYDKPLINKGEITLAQMLKNAGYKTAAIGKWHLGWDWQVKEGFPSDWGLKENMKGNGIDLSKPIKGGPVDVGFDYYYGMDVPNFPPYCYIEKNKIIGDTVFRQKPDSIYGDPGLMQTGWDYNSMLSGITDRAKQYIIHQTKNEKAPFFLYLALTAPHVPLTPAREFQGKSNAGKYGDLVVEMDYRVGEVITCLKEQGIINNTLIIFTSDNGSHARVGDPALGKYCQGVGDVIHQYNHYANGILKGFKGDAWEGGHRVPFIACWPEKIPANTINHQLICLTDIMPTIASAIDVKLSDSVAIDGMDMLPVFFDTKEQGRKMIVHHSGSGKLAIRKNQWKLIMANDGGSGYSRAYFEKYAPGSWQNDYEGQLYNMKADIGEDNNLFGNKPELVKELELILNEIKK